MNEFFEDLSFKSSGEKFFNHLKVTDLQGPDVEMFLSERNLKLTPEELIGFMVSDDIRKYLEGQWEEFGIKWDPDLEGARRETTIQSLANISMFTNLRMLGDNIEGLPFLNSLNPAHKPDAMELDRIRQKANTLIGYFNQRFLPNSPGTIRGL